MGENSKEFKPERMKVHKPTLRQLFPEGPLQPTRSREPPELKQKTSYWLEVSKNRI